MGWRHCRAPLMVFVGMVIVVIFLDEGFCSVRPKGALQNNLPSYSVLYLDIFSPFGSWHRGGPRPSSKVCVWDPTGSMPLPDPLVSCQLLPIGSPETQKIFFIRRSRASLPVSRKVKQAIVEPLHILSSVDWSRLSSPELGIISCTIFCSGLSGVSVEIMCVSEGSHPSQPPSPEAYIMVLGSRSSASGSMPLVHIPEVCHRPFKGLISLQLTLFCIILIVGELVALCVERLPNDVVLVLFQAVGHRLHHRRRAMGPR